MELAWLSDVNRSVGDQTTIARLSLWEAWYFLAALCGNSNAGGLTGGTWTLLASSNGASWGPGSDWLAITGSGAFDHAKFVRGDTGTNHSWALLESPGALGAGGNPVHMVFDCNASAFSITFFTSGTTTGAALNQAPASTLGANDTWGNTALALNNGSIAANHRVSMQLSARGDFYFQETFDGNGQLYTLIGLTKLQGAHAADAYPVVAMVVQSNLIGDGAHGLAAAYQGIGGILSTILLGRSFDGSAAPTLVVPCPAVQNGGGVGLLVAILTTTGLVPGPSVSDGTYNGLPADVVSIGAGAEWKGRLADVTWVSGSLGQGAVLPDGGPYEYLKQGDMLLPWKSASAPVW